MRAPVISGDAATATQGYERGHSGKWQPLQSSPACGLDNGEFVGKLPRVNVVTARSFGTSYLDR